MLTDTLVIPNTISSLFQKSKPLQVTERGYELRWRTWGPLVLYTHIVLVPSDDSPTDIVLGYTVPVSLLQKLLLHLLSMTIRNARIQLDRGDTAGLEMLPSLTVFTLA